MDTQHVTQLLKLAEDGDTSASNELYSILYEELRNRAQLILGHRVEWSTLQPTVLVHEAWMKLIRQDSAGWNDRAHFLRVAAHAMRSILVDHARSKKTKKRGGEKARVELKDVFAVYQERAEDLLALDEALERLGAMDSELGRVVELRFFGGLSIDETAKVLEVSASTVERGWRTARTWLQAELDKT